MSNCSDQTKITGLDPRFADLWYVPVQTLYKVRHTYIYYNWDGKYELGMMRGYLPVGVDRDIESPHDANAVL